MWSHNLKMSKGDFTWQKQVSNEEKKRNFNYVSK